VSCRFFDADLRSSSLRSAAWSTCRRPGPAKIAEFCGLSARPTSSMYLPRSALTLSAVVGLSPCGLRRLTKFDLRWTTTMTTATSQQSATMACLFCPRWNSSAVLTCKTAYIQRFAQSLKPSRYRPLTNLRHIYGSSAYSRFMVLIRQ